MRIQILPSAEGKPRLKEGELHTRHCGRRCRRRTEPRIIIGEPSTAKRDMIPAWPDAFVVMHVPGHVSTLLRARLCPRFSPKVQADQVLTHDDSWP